jgi:flagellar hook-basal body complex protein FliE
MNINGLGSITPPISLGSSDRLGSASGGGSSFGSTVKQAVEALDNSQKSAEQEVSKAVTGESPDLHKTIIALQTADLNFQFGLQVRNKLVGAYEEIMRMQV